MDDELNCRPMIDQMLILSDKLWIAAAVLSYCLGAFIIVEMI